MTHGVRQIVCLNWPFYLIAGACVALTTVCLSALPAAETLGSISYLPSTLAVLWIGGSLAASWHIYDRSPLMQWYWIPDVLDLRPRSWINVHAGLDESTPVLRRLLQTDGRVFDIFDPAEMTEPSIARARRLARATAQSEQVDFRKLPARSLSTDAAFLLLSAHELRTRHARDAFFRELHRILTPHGRVVVAEHLRDWSNFAAFGPGFLHFHSRRTWSRCFTDTGFDVRQEFSITPFVRIFVLGKRASQ